MFRFAELTANTLSLALTVGAITTQNISLLYVPIGLQLATGVISVQRLKKPPEELLTHKALTESLLPAPLLPNVSDDRSSLLENYYYNMVIGRGQSRDLFIKSLSEASHSLVIVCPWIPKWVMNTYMTNLFRLALARGVNINIGYGHLADVDNDRSRLSRDALLSTSKSDWYAGILELEKLQKEYRHLNLYVIGTHEKYYVVDNEYCVLGSHNFLTSGASSSEREMGLHTNNSEIVKQLLDEGFMSAIKS